MKLVMIGVTICFEFYLFIYMLFYYMFPFSIVHMDVYYENWVFFVFLINIDIPSTYKSTWCYFKC